LVVDAAVDDRSSDGSDADLRDLGVIRMAPKRLKV
jgi:hypothetical protein